MIKVVVFDLDGMVLKRREYFSDKLKRKLAISEEEVMPFFKREFKDCQKGRLELKKVLENKYFPIWDWRKGFNEFINWWFSGEKIDNKLMETIKKIKKNKIKTVLLTNNERYRLEFIINEFKLKNIFDLIVLPYEIETIKPEKKCWNKLLTMTNVKAQNILVCDDRKQRLKGAKELGFKTHIYTTLNQFKAELKKHKIQIL